MPIGPDRARSLDILLYGRKIATLVRAPGDVHVFSLEHSYREAGGLPRLSLSLMSATGALLPDPKPTRRDLPTLFANMLPEGKLREAMERFHAKAVRPGNDFDMLARLGDDLPGAVQVTAPEGLEEPHKTPNDDKARFSLSGVQLKLSVMKNAGKNGGITLPVGDQTGSYIAKFPSLNVQGLSENEFAMLALAQAVGIDVPHRELVDKKDFSGIPESFDTVSDEKVLLVKRFDRDGANRIHMEDTAQIFGVYPRDKYKQVSSQNIASMLATAASFEDAMEFVRRLAFSAATGNGDMHLKNWSVIHPADGGRPRLSPAYDLVSTVPYIAGEKMALSIAGEKEFSALTQDRWRSFAVKAKLPERAVIDAAVEMTEAVAAAWRALPEKDVVPKAVRERIGAHIEHMLHVVDAHAPEEAPALK